MPLARIFTLLPERATALSLQLKKQGYTIEILRPGQTSAEAADLEIDLEICPQTEAFRRAIELASKLKADIAVAPGSIRFAPEPLVVPVDPAPVAPTPAMIEVPIEPTAPIAPAAPSFAEVVEPARPLTPPPEAMPPREPARQQTFASSRPASPDLGVRLSEAWQQARPSLEKAAAGFEEWCRGAVATCKTMFSRARESSSKGFSGLSESAHSGSLSARQWLRAARERARLRAAESRARRQEQLLESEQRRARTDREAAELRVAREAAAARLLQIRLEAGGQIQEQEASRAASASAEPVTRQSAFEGAFDRRRASRQIKIRRRYSSQLEAILTGVAAVSALFVIGLVVASFQPRSALSRGLDPSYKGATVQGGGVTLKPAPTKAVAPRPSPAVKTNNVRTRPAQSKPSPHPSTQNQNDVTVDDGQDVSVRHFAAPRKPPMQSARQGGGMKRYSDFDN